ncbi:MAG: nucleotidyltransferase family protein [Phycisphaerales bacterium]
MKPADASIEAIAGFCRRWGVARLWLFGSLATGTAGASSDADVLIEFLPQAETSTWDWPRMQDELRAIFGREIDLLSTGVLRNPFRRRAILASRRLLYAA